MALSAARGVTQVMNRCEDAKVSGFLDFSDCSLMYIADAIYLVLRGCQISRCSLKNNKLKKLPPKLITNFPHMDVINLEGNQLTELPSEIGQWHALRGINLANNRLERLPEPLLSCGQLSLLDLSGNSIEDIDADALQRAFPALRQLHLRECPISEAKIEAIRTRMGSMCQIVHK
uniref:Leucine Rich repeat-containing domain protein n=1 Tax=Globodera pallida TaxID=36090 RepID=A0A183BW11_GLOPA